MGMSVLFAPDYTNIYILDLHMTPSGVMLHEGELVAENHWFSLVFREFVALGSLARLGSILEASWAVLESVGGVLERLRGILERLGGVLERIGRRFGASWRRLGGVLERLGAS